MLEPNQFPARFVLAGVVLNVFQAPAGQTREGKDFGGDYRIQLMSCDHLRNGEKKLIPTEVSVGDDDQVAGKYRQLSGRVVKLPVSVYAIGGDIRVALADRGADPNPPARKPGAPPVVAVGEEVRS